MFQQYFIHPALLIVSLLLLQPCYAQAEAGSLPNTRTASYNFDYKIAGDRAVAPAQVFDNGSRIYLQFHDMSTLPAIFADTPMGEVLLKPGIEYTVEPPYVVIRSIEPELILMMNKRKATISYQGPITEFITKTPVMYGAKQPIALSTNIAPPITPDAFVKDRQNAQSASTKVTHVETPMTITSASASPPASKDCYAISRRDMKLSDLLDEWATKAGYQLSWEISGEEPLLSMTGQFCGKSFEEALDIVLASYADTTPIKAVFHRKNNAIQIISGSK
jgi:hypothetical protein